MQTDANGQVRFEVDLIDGNDFVIGPVTHPPYSPSPEMEVLDLADGETRQVAFPLIAPYASIVVQLVDRAGNPLRFAGVDVPIGPKPS